MRITVSGPPGSGTTSLARHLSTSYGYEMISAGDVFRQIAKERGMDIAALGKTAENDHSIDALIDVRQKEIAQKRDNLVIEGRLSGWMVENADLKIWLTAPLSCRAKRIATRDGVDEYTARMLTTVREACESRRYQNYYKIDITDLSPYHLALSSERWTTEQLGSIVETAVSFLKK
ncbi:MAG: AAA family ATPase [Methanomicrobiales archaeon]|nr:AAA family ATPase [Methanomicrobiales archaeon]